MWVSVQHSIFSRFFMYSFFRLTFSPRVSTRMPFYWVTNNYLRTNSHNSDHCLIKQSLKLVIANCRNIVKNLKCYSMYKSWIFCCHRISFRWSNFVLSFSLHCIPKWQKSTWWWWHICFSQKWGSTTSLYILQSIKSGSTYTLKTNKAL